MHAWWTIVAGAVVVAFALREIFQDLFQPTAAGLLSGYIARRIFRMARRSRSTLTLAGPLALVIVILCWTGLLGIGFALIYWSSFPNGFKTAPGERNSVLSAVYFSFEALTTLGLGDIAPKTDWIRMVAVLEALLGFSLVTASITWIVLIYPALGRMRTLARHAAILIKAEERTRVEVISGDGESLIAELAVGVIRTRIDFIHFPIIYYFHSSVESASLPEALGHLMYFAQRGFAPGAPDRVRLASAALRAALDELAEALRSRFLRSETKEAASVFEAYARDHLVALKSR